MHELFIDNFAGGGKGRNSDGSVPNSIFHCKEQNVKGRITGTLTKNCTTNYKPNYFDYEAIIRKRIGNSK